MSKLSNVFNKPGHTALIAYLTAGYPDAETTRKAVPLLAEKGCDIIEIGIPFSDPLADGVTIQNASYQALQNGITPAACLKLVADVRKETDVPLVFMSYYNPIFHYGVERFCEDSAKAGVDGFIIPDLPPEEGEELETFAGSHGIDLIYLLSPTSNDERIELASRHSSGFIYLVSVTGVTGARSFLPSDLKAFIDRVRKHTDKPLCVGFGISTPEQAAQVGSMADGVIVGSRIIQYLESDRTLSEAGNFVAGLRKALDNG